MIRFRSNLGKAAFILLVMVLVSACSGGAGLYGGRPKTSPRLAKNVATDATQAWHPTAKNSIPVTINGPVQKWVSTFTGPLRPSFTRWMQRIGQYAPAIEKILDEEGAPRDLIYLAMIESGFNMSATSSASASGPWQFIASTGKMYGLERDFFTDDRHDFVQATRAAARHLLDLYKIYGDWYLSFAAYNAGSGKVNQAIKRGKSTDYWQLSAKKSRLFRQETKDYVPKILAALTIVKNYKKYGFNADSFGNPIEYDKVTVPDATDVSVIAQSAGTSSDVIKGLNPALVKGITPPGESFDVFVPKGAAEEFKRNYAMVPASKRVSNLQYQASANETLVSIGKKFHVSTSELVKLNGYDTKQKLKSGTLVQVPANKGTLVAMAQIAQQAVGKQTKTISHKVRAGEDIGKIARKYGVSTGKIAKWNHLKSGARLKIGQQLKIYRHSAAPLNFAATRGDGRRYSGISSIIIEEQQNPVNVTTNEPVQQVEAPVMFATIAPDFENGFSGVVDDQPAVIKTIDGQIIDANIDEQTETPVKPKASKSAYHLVKSGENLNTIAAKYDLRVAELKALNGITSDKINANAKLLVKKNIEKTAATTPKAIVAAKPLLTNVQHEVNANESLGVIAKKYGVSVDQIRQWNNLSTNYVRVGQQLKILRNTPTALPTVAAAASLANQNRTITHSVKTGESLWSLSKRYGVKVSDIIKWNNLKENQVRPNQKIKIVALANRSSAAL